MSISVLSVASENMEASVVPTAEPASANAPAMSAGSSTIFPLFKNFSVAISVPVPLTTLLVPAARCAGMPAIR